MSNRMYTTKAIVCGSKYSMTSDKSYLLFTEEIGMLWATARSVRMEKSKQRYALQDFSIIRVSLVQGKSGWRIGSVEALCNPFLEAISRTSRGGVSYIVKTLRRYIHGEEVAPHVFTDAVAVLSAVSALESVATVEIHQMVFEIRMLSQLGYITNTNAIHPLLSAQTFIHAVEVYDHSKRTMLEKSIEHASQVSHL